MSAAYAYSAPIGASESSVSDYWALLKPRVMSLVLFTGFAGYWAAPSHPQVFLGFVAMLCLAVNAGAAGAINMALEGDIDALMKRTEARPIPQGRVNPAEALTMGIVLSLASVMLMGMALNWLAAGLLAFANFFYVFVYTLGLKRRTPQNIVIGGAAGAFPPVIGWAAAAGSLSLYPVILFLIIFFWTPPHFWALSLFANEDYKRANIPMLPVVAGERATRIHMLAYTIILFPLTLAPWALGYASAFYAAVAAALGALFILAAVRVCASADLKHARRMFGYSVFYLFALFLAVMAG